MPPSGSAAWIDRTASQLELTEILQPLFRPRKLATDEDSGSSPPTLFSWKKF
jgi:hypothetical protein